MICYSESVACMAYSEELNHKCSVECEEGKVVVDKVNHTVASIYLRRQLTDSASHVSVTCQELEKL